MNSGLKIDQDMCAGDELSEGSRLLNGQYQIDRYLASGGFGITYLATDSLDRTVVIKECFPEAFCTRKGSDVYSKLPGKSKEFRSLVGLFEREARNLAKLDHAGIVGVHQVFRDNNTAYMALDFIEGVDLLDFINDKSCQFIPAQVKTILVSTLKAVHVIHENDMLHRDISPDNILLCDDLRTVLIDFGAAREEASKKTRALSSMLVVKDGYSPQEFYIAGAKQSASSDLYALAATFVHVISGEAPPDSQARLAAVASQKPDPYKKLTERITGYEASFLAAIDKAMSLFSDDRIQSAQDWIATINSGSLQEQATDQFHSEQEIQKTVSQLISQVQVDIAAELEKAAIDTKEREVAEALRAAQNKELEDRAQEEARAEALREAAEIEALEEAARIEVELAANPPEPELQSAYPGACHSGDDPMEDGSLSPAPERLVSLRNAGLLMRLSAVLVLVSGFFFSTIQAENRAFAELQRRAAQTAEELGEGIILLPASTVRDAHPYSIPERP
jgi:serine/threonine protein kinase